MFRRTFLYRLPLITYSLQRLFLIHSLVLWLLDLGKMITIL
nr:MAG TPA: hypothetical protein [Caudoviricetes sp.]